MFNSIAVKSAAFALLLVGAVVGAVDAQTISIPLDSIPRDARQRCKSAGGLFPLSNGTARFYVSLDDGSSEPDIFVVMRFINHVGTVVKSSTVRIVPGGSAMLEYSGTGFYRVQAEAFDPATSLRFSKWRTVVPSLSYSQEVRAVSGPGGLLGNDIIFQWVGPGPIDPPPCKSAIEEPMQ
jgi:hypothetical protein